MSDVFSVWKIYHVHSWQLNLTTMADNLFLKIFQEIGKANHNVKLTQFQI